MLNSVPDIIIAVDGFSATGKSTLSKLISKEFSFLYLDSGALYRAVTLFALEQGMIEGTDKIDVARLLAALPSLDLRFSPDSKTYIADRCVEADIRSLKVSSSVSPIAAIAQVRSFVDSKLHEFAKKGRVVMDGRDIGTTVFPDAELKLFVVADDQVRAERRYDELKAKGQNPSMEEVLSNLKERDRIDSSREASPLKKADDAYVLDNSDMSFHEEIVWIKGLIMGKFGILE